VRGSTALGERLGAGRFFALMNRFYGVATEVLLARGATIDKLVGDGLMALFIPGFCGPEYRRLAALSAEALLHAAGYGGGGRPWLRLGVGVHAGNAFVGKVGTAEVNDVTALGDTVNTAARLQGEAAPGEAVFSETVYEAVSDRYPRLRRRIVTLRGRTQPPTVRVLRVRAQGTHRRRMATARAPLEHDQVTR
jgi:class 3 adenylate cyclase